MKTILYFELTKAKNCYSPHKTYGTILLNNIVRNIILSLTNPRQIKIEYIDFSGSNRSFIDISICWVFQRRKFPTHSCDRKIYRLFMVRRYCVTQKSMINW